MSEQNWIDRSERLDVLISEIGLSYGAEGLLERQGARKLRDLILEKQAEPDDFDEMGRPLRYADDDPENDAVAHVIDRARVSALFMQAAREPIGVDLSDYSDEYCEGFVHGQVNALEALGHET